MAQVQRRQFNDIFEAVGSGSLAVADPASLADGAGVSHTVTVPGAELGDIVFGASASVSTQGMLLEGNVTAANTVIVRLQNESGGAVDLAAYTIKVAVGRIRV